VPVKVKICGVTRVEDARHAHGAGADFLGVNFWAGSPRVVSVERARAIRDAVPAASLVGVFVDAPRDEVERTAEAVGLALLQFHGDEPAAYCRGWTRPVIKAVRVPAGASATALAAPFADVAYVLVDAAVAGRPGGTGVRVAGEALEELSAAGLGARLFLAGGLTPENVAEAVRRVRPFAVDVASGVEQGPGVKDHGKIDRFIRNAKGA
jgi:phosphoribosylanthranilate isomerase